MLTWREEKVYICSLAVETGKKGKRPTPYIVDLKPLYIEFRSMVMDCKFYVGINLQQNCNCNMTLSTQFIVFLCSFKMILTSYQVITAEKKHLKYI